MKALRVEKKGIALRDIERPELAGEVLVRVVLSGICNTDLEIARGYAGFRGTIGHEFVGVIESIPNSGAEARPRGPQPSSSAGVGRLGRVRSDSEPSLTVGLLQVGQR